MKGKIQGIIGLLVIGFLAFALIKSIYKRYFAEQEFTVIKPIQNQSEIKDALFWYEEELEKTAGVMISAKLSADATLFTNSLFNDLKTTGMVSDQIKTMSDKATKAMIALDAYRGTEPNVWAIAKENGKPYIFKVMVTGFDGKKRTTDLTSVIYRFSLYDTTTKNLIWEAETTRMAGFFGGMPENEKTITVLKKYLKEGRMIK